MAAPDPALDAVISFRWRLALVAKAVLLLILAAGFGWLAFKAIDDVSIRLGALACTGFTALALFIAWAASTGLADAVVGKAKTEEGVRVLPSRRRGYSMRAPSGRFVEFILWNPWGPLDPGSEYRVTYGRYSGVIVQQPVAIRPIA